MNGLPKDFLYTIDQAASIVGRTEAALGNDRFCHRGLPYVQDGKRRIVRYRKSDVDEWLKTKGYGYQFPRGRYGPRHAKPAQPPVEQIAIPEPAPVAPDIPGPKPTALPVQINTTPTAKLVSLTLQVLMSGYLVSILRADGYYLQHAFTKFHEAYDCLFSVLEEHEYKD